MAYVTGKWASTERIMATDIENLKTIKSNILASVVEYTANPKPSYILDGQEVEWTEWFEAMMQRVKEIDELIAAEEPYEIMSQGVTP